MIWIFEMFSRNIENKIYLGIFRHETTKNNFSREHIRRVKTTHVIKGKKQSIPCCRNIFNSEKKMFYKKDIPNDDEPETLPKDIALHEVGESSRQSQKVWKRFFQIVTISLNVELSWKPLEKRIVLPNIPTMFENRKEEKLNHMLMHQIRGKTSKKCKPNIKIGISDSN